jgi:hypothetical protein
MTSEEFNKQYANLILQEQELADKKKALKKEFIDTNQPYPIGTKLKVMYGNKTVGIGFVRGYDTMTKAYGEWGVIPILGKVNKDGTMHKTATLFIMHWFPDLKYEVIE